MDDFVEALSAILGLWALGIAVSAIKSLFHADGGHFD